MKIVGVVEDGSGTNSRLAAEEPASFLDALGYRPFPGTLNIRVSKRDRGRLVKLTAKFVSDTLFWAAEVDVIPFHVRCSRDARTMEVVHPYSLRERYRNGCVD